jgi:protein-S-isoprenylcysteine O-methyltransferase Ste14
VIGKYVDDHVKLTKRPFNRALRAALIVAFPVLFVGLFVVAPGLWASRHFEVPIGLGADAALVLGTVLCVLGGALYLWTVVLFAKAWGTQVPVAPTQRLVTTGPYAVTRNPMVTSAIIMILGVGVVANSWSFIIAGLVMPLHYLLYIKLIEERELQARFGDEYVEYRKSTPFIVPRAFRARTRRSPSG